MRNRLLTLTAAGLVLASATTLGACSAPTDTATAATVKAATVSTAIPFAYAGDSITNLPGSWYDVMKTDTRFTSVGGYARAGYRTDQVLDRITAVPGADVLVLELGTNDINQQVPTQTILNNMQAIIDKVGARKTFVVATPPSDITEGGAYGTNRQLASTTFNRQLAVWAGYRGYVYFDPFVVYREPNNSWTPGTSTDGVHPTNDASVTIEKWFAWGIQQASAAARG